MKRLLSVLMVLVSISVSSKAQSIDDFCLPDFRSAEEASKYVGHRVVVHYRSTKDPKYKDAKKFDRQYGSSDIVYTINKIKFGSQITFNIVSEHGTKWKVPVGLNGASNYDALSSCGIFFSLDKFNTDKKKYIGNIYKNLNGEEVAVVEDLELVTAFESEPKFIYTLRSKINNEKFKCESTEVEGFCKYLGITLTHPKVKASYKVIGGTNTFASDYFFSVYYEYENTITGDIATCMAEHVETAPFEKALKGKYVSLLNKVEKPSNPEIRYGETTVIESEDAVSKFSYKDNVIDILVFGVRDGFSFVLQNISDSTIKIIWDEAVFVNFDGSTEKVMHKGTKYAERNESQPATTIIKNAKWEDSVIPTHLVYYNEGSKYIKAGWDTHKIYPYENALDPGQLMLMLPIQIKDVINEYIFVFDVKYVYEHPELLNL